jgi:hypothetical protein
MRDHSEDPVDEMVTDIAKILNAQDLQKQSITVEWPAVLIITTPQ